MANTTADKLNYLQGTKDAIKQAIIDKGVAITPEDNFRSYATKIGEIQGGGGGVGASTTYKALNGEWKKEETVNGYSRVLFPSGVLCKIEDNFYRMNRAPLQLELESESPDDIEIGVASFSDCGLTKIKCINGLKSIGMYAFRDNTSLTSFEGITNHTNIGDGAFYYCSSLVMPVIQNGARFDVANDGIQSEAFRGCSSLGVKEISAGQILDYAFDGASSASELSVWLYPMYRGHGTDCRINSLPSGANKITIIQDIGHTIIGDTEIFTGVPDVYLETNNVPSLEKYASVDTMFHVKQSDEQYYREDTNWSQCNIVGDIY